MATVPPIALTIDSSALQSILSGFFTQITDRIDKQDQRIQQSDDAAAGLTEKLRTESEAVAKSVELSNNMKANEVFLESKIDKLTTALAALENRVRAQEAAQGSAAIPSAPVDTEAGSQAAAAQAVAAAQAAATSSVGQVSNSIDAISLRLSALEASAHATSAKADVAHSSSSSAHTLAEKAHTLAMTLTHTQHAAASTAAQLQARFEEAEALRQSREAVEAMPPGEDRDEMAERLRRAEGKLTLLEDSFGLVQHVVDERQGIEVERGRVNRMEANDPERMGALEALMALERDVSDMDIALQVIRRAQDERLRVDVLRKTGGDPEEVQQAELALAPMEADAEIVKSYLVHNRTIRALNLQLSKLGPGAEMDEVFQQRDKYRQDLRVLQPEAIRIISASKVQFMVELTAPAARADAAGASIPPPKEPSFKSQSKEEAEKEEFAKAFAEMDKDGDGSLSTTELLQGLLKQREDSKGMVEDLSAAVNRLTKEQKKNQAAFEGRVRGLETTVAALPDQLAARPATPPAAPPPVDTVKAEELETLRTEHDKLEDKLAGVDRRLREACILIEAEVINAQNPAEDADVPKVDGYWQSQMKTKYGKKEDDGAQNKWHHGEVEKFLVDKKKEIRDMKDALQDAKEDVRSLTGEDRRLKELEIAELTANIQEAEGALDQIVNAPFDSIWFAKRLSEAQGELTKTHKELRVLSNKVDELTALADQAAEEESDYNIESKWLEEINLLHNTIENVSKQASKAVDVDKLQKSFESNLEFLRNQIKTEIGAKADQAQIEDALREVVERVEASQQEPDEEAKVEALHAALNLIHREMQGKADAGRLMELDENLRAIEERNAPVDGALRRTPINSICLACDRPFTSQHQQTATSPGGTPLTAMPQGLGPPPSRGGPLAAPPSSFDPEFNTFVQTETWTKSPHSRANHFYRNKPMHQRGGALQPIDRRHRLKREQQGSRGSNYDHSLIQMPGKPAAMGNKIRQH